MSILFTNSCTDNSAEKSIMNKHANARMLKSTGPVLIGKQVNEYRQRSRVGDAKVSNAPYKYEGDIVPIFDGNFEAIEEKGCKMHDLITNVLEVWVPFLLSFLVDALPYIFGFIIGLITAAILFV